MKFDYNVKRDDKMFLEVETKVRVDNPNELRKKIRKIANFVKRQSRSDDYFAIKRKGYPKKAFRIRSTSEDNVVNFKKWLRSYWDSSVVVKKEYEFKIKDKDSFLALMDDLGFEQWVKKFKTTEAYEHKKDKRIVIEINKVRHLGYFMEIEYLARKSEMKSAKKKIRAVLKELDIKPEQVDNTGYTKMLWDKGIKDKKYFINLKY